MGTVPSFDYIKPFIDATTSTLLKLAQVQIAPKSVFLKDESNKLYGVSGVIELSGQAEGVVVLSFTEEMAIRVINRILGEDNADINANVVDGVNELANIITGNAKSALVQKGYQFDIGLPHIVIGRTHLTVQAHLPSCTVIAFTSDMGQLFLEVGIRRSWKRKTPAEDMARA